MKFDNQPQNTSISVQQLNNRILDFVRRDAPDYAIMISGPWGCGKTFYVKHNLALALENEADISYFSLHGVESFHELDARMLLGRNRLTKKLSEQTKNKIASTPSIKRDESSIVHICLKFGANVLPWLKHLWHRVSSRKERPTVLPELVFIDDLERLSSSLSVEDVLGYLYTHLISEGKHVVFICDETQLALSGSSYRKTREKCIRRVYPFLEIDDSLLDSLIASRCPDSDIAEAVRKIQPWIADFMRRHEIKNLRTASMFIDGYSDLVRNLADPAFFDKAGVAIVENMFPLYNEMALGNLSLDKLSTHAGLDNLDAYRYSAILANHAEHGGGDERKTDYPLEFLKRYDTPFCQWEFLPEVFRFALTEEVNADDFKRDFSRICREQSEAEQAMNIVRNYHLFDEDELSPAVEKCLQEMDAGHYEYRELSNMAFCLSMIDKRHYLSGTEWKLGLEKRMLSAVDRVSRPPTLKEAERLYDQWLRSPFPEMLAGDLQQIVNDRIKEHIRQVYVSKRSEAVGKVFDSLQSRREPMYDYINDRSRDNLLPDIVLFGFQQRIVELSSFGLVWMENYIQRRFLDVKSFSSPQEETLTAAANIKEVVLERLTSNELSEARRARLTEFLEMLVRLEKHLMETSPQRSINEDVHTLSDRPDTEAQRM